MVGESVFGPIAKAICSPCEFVGSKPNLGSSCEYLKLRGLISSLSQKMKTIKLLVVQSKWKLSFDKF